MNQIQKTGRTEKTPHLQDPQNPAAGIAAHADHDFAADDGDGADWLQGVKGAVFDLDGTLIDSMPFWQTLSQDYLRSIGITRFPPDFEKTLETMTVKEAADWMVRLYDLPQDARQVEADLNERMRRHYLQDVPLKPGTRSLLEHLEQSGIVMAAATATDLTLACQVLERLGIRHYFQQVFSCEQMHTSKNHPDIYLAAARHLHTRVEEFLL